MIHSCTVSDLRPSAVCELPLLGVRRATLPPVEVPLLGRRGQVQGQGCCLPFAYWRHWECLAARGAYWQVAMILCGDGEGDGSLDKKKIETSSARSLFSLVQRLPGKREFSPSPTSPPRGRPAQRRRPPATGRAPRSLQSSTGLPPCHLLAQPSQLSPNTRRCLAPLTPQTTLQPTRSRTAPPLPPPPSLPY